MSLVVFFAISWLVISIYLIMKKELILIESSFIFLFVLAISINYSWIIIDELKLITIKEMGIPYMAYLLNRSVVVPFLMLIALELFLKSKSMGTKVVTLILSVIILSFSKFLLSLLKVSKFDNWNVMYDGVYFIAFLLITIFVYKWFNQVLRNAVTDS